MSLRTTPVIARAGGETADIADVLRNLAFAQRQKALSSQEKKMYEHARNLIVSEIAQINGLPEHEVATKVEEALDRAIPNRHPAAVAIVSETAEA